MTKRTVEEVLGPLNRVEEKHAPEVLYLKGDENLLRSGLTRVHHRHAQAVCTGAGECALVRGVPGPQWRDGRERPGHGIDTVAHRTTIACGGSTIAVLGTPLDKVNPPSNADLQREIGERYLLVSQFDHRRRIIVNPSRRSCRYARAPSFWWTMW